MDNTDHVLEFLAPHGQSPQLWNSLAEELPLLLAAGSGVADGRVKVLDCGGGSGRFAVPLAGLGAHVSVVDPSADALSTLLRRAEDAGVSGLIAAYQGDAESLTQVVRPGQFGLVVAHDVLHSVSNCELAVSQLFDCLAPNGVLSLLNSNPVAAVLSRALAGDARGALAILDRDLNHRNELVSYIDCCERNGLVIEAVTGLGVFTELVSGRHVDGTDTAADFAALEAATYARMPYRDIAAKIHVLARRPAMTRS